MTILQTITAKKIVKDYEDKYGEKPIPVNMGDRIIYLQRNTPILHPHYKMLANGNILFGVGMEYTEHGQFVIGIRSWKIIQPNGIILDKTNFTTEEMELAEQFVELSSFNSRDDLIRF
jgi:hypothetical protein